MDSMTWLHIYRIVRYFISEGLIIAHGKNLRRDQRLLVSVPKDTGKVG